MARRLSLNLSIEQVKTLHEAAKKVRDEAADPAVRERWDAIVRKAERALLWSSGSPAKSEVG